MAQFALPKNSKISGKSRKHQATTSGAKKNFKVYRYDPDSGENPRYDMFEIDLEAFRAGRIPSIPLIEVIP